MPNKSLRHGVYLPPFGPFGNPTVLVDLAIRAEAAGWDGVFLWDHLVTDAMPIVDPWTTLGAIAHATDRIRLGTMVTPLARRRPWVVARHAETLSLLSGGRFVLGTGLGSDESGDFSRFGEPADLRTRAALYDEGLDIIKTMRSGHPAEHDGVHYTVRLKRTTPAPHRIPIWVGCSTAKPQVLRRAAGCDGIFPNPEGHRLTPEELTAILASAHKTGLIGDRPFDVAVAGNASHAWQEPIEVDVHGLHKAGMTWWMESLIHFDPLELSLKIVDAGPPRIG
ncbi:LLM class flavin-dependent oxidoreductase [Nocardia sp. NPDC050435]|uniref:LLM class flavin-dependent oxidoreductase n=1 Tax=Nocardia sp. NPDC050435 TaxID=3155040 RepID=UPI0033CBE7CE